MSYGPISVQSVFDVRTREPKDGRKTAGKTLYMSAIGLPALHTIHITRPVRRPSFGCVSESPKGKESCSADRQCLLQDSRNEAVKIQKCL